LSSHGYSTSLDGIQRARAEFRVEAARVDVAAVRQRAIETPGRLSNMAIGLFHEDGRNVPVVMKAGVFLKGEPRAFPG
jgi:hypothetical protein